MKPIPVYAGVVVRDLAASVPWYESMLGCQHEESGATWVVLSFPNGSRIELFEGDPARPGPTFPSYGDIPAPCVMPGFSVEEPELLAADVPVARQLPEWVVVVAPDGLRVVLSAREGDGQSGLVGFRFTSPDPPAQLAFLASLGIDAVVEEGSVAAIPVVRSGRDAAVADPDGTGIVLVT